MDMKKLWVITWDEKPEPWEDFSYPYQIVEGEEDQVKKYTQQLQKNMMDYLNIVIYQFRGSKNYELCNTNSSPFRE